MICLGGQAKKGDLSGGCAKEACLGDLLSEGGGGGGVSLVKTRFVWGIYCLRRVSESFIWRAVMNNRLFCLEDGFC